jgi:SPP1 family predicted phage head-tail adaptor
MQAGKLRHYVTFERLDVSFDSEGATVEEWVPLFDGRRIPADVDAISGRELLAANALQSKVSTRIVIRYRQGLLPQDRIVYGDTIYSIEAIVPDPHSRRQWITLQCSDGPRQG